MSFPTTEFDDILRAGAHLNVSAQDYPNLAWANLATLANEHGGHLTIRDASQVHATSRIRIAQAGRSSVTIQD